MIELPLLRVRSFALANLAAMVFFAGFGAMLLSGVLLLTEVWGYSALKAGFALSPGPLMAALFAIPSGRLGGRIGSGRSPPPGASPSPPASPTSSPGRRRRPEYATTFLPGFMLGGAGVGMVLGTLPAAVTASLPPERFATGTAVFGMARQLGSAIGVAVLVALLNDTTGGDLLAGLQRGWWFALARRPRHRGARPRLRPGRGPSRAGAGPRAAGACLARKPSLIEGSDRAAAALVLGDLRLQVGLGHLGGAAAPAHLVLRLHHLAHVVDLVLHLDLGRAGRLPVDQIGCEPG